MYQSKANISLLWLLVVAFLGLILRSFPVFNVPFNFQNLLQAHSHVAFLGWVYTALFTLICTMFLESKFSIAKHLKRQFYLSQIAVLGMLISFPFTGYGAISISFCTLHMIVSGWFALTTYKACRVETGAVLPVSLKFLFAGLAFMVVSSVGPLSLPLIVKFLGKDSSFYNNAIYFYLHFQYNGWFIFALFALLFRRLEDKQIVFPVQRADALFRGLIISCVLTYFLSVLWSKPPLFVWALSLTGAIVQFACLFVFYGIIRKTKFELSPWLKKVGIVVIIAFSLKVLLQLFSAMPLLIPISTSIRHFIIAYLHLVLLGIVTLSVFGYYLTMGYIRVSSVSTRLGLLLFLIGFLVSETLAVLEGALNYFSNSMQGYGILQLTAAVTIAAGLLFVYSGRRKTLRLTVSRIYLNPFINNSKFQL